MITKYHSVASNYSGHYVYLQERMSIFAVALRNQSLDLEQRRLRYAAKRITTAANNRRLIWTKFADLSTATTS